MRRILVVDEDRHVDRAVRAWLKHRGFRIAARGAAERAASDAANFDLTIVDVVMPPTRGLEPLWAFPNRSRPVPAIAMSGSAFPDLKTAGADFDDPAAGRGVTRRLRQPFKPATLLEVIDQCLSQAKTYRSYVTTLGDGDHADRTASAVRAGN